MPAEDMALNFVLRATDAGMTRTMDAIHTRIERTQKILNEVAAREKAQGLATHTTRYNQLHSALMNMKSTATAAAARMHAVGLAVTFVAERLHASYKEWSRFNETMDRFRISAGLSLKEVAATREMVIDTTARYGIALQEVAGITRFVALGSRDATKNVKELTEALALAQRASGLTTDQMERMNNMMTNVLGFSATQVEQNFYAMRQAAREARMDFGEFSGVIVQQNELFARYREHGPALVRQVSAIIGEMHKAGATGDQINEMLQRFNDVTGPLGQQFRESIMSGRVDMVAQLRREMDELRSRQGTPEFDQYSDWLGVRLQTARSLVRIVGDELPAAEQRYREAASLSTDEIRQKMQQQMTGAERLKASFERMGAGLSRFWESLNQHVLDPLATAMSRIVDTITNILGTLSTMVGNTFAALFAAVTGDINTMWVALTRVVNAGADALNGLITGIQKVIYADPFATQASEDAAVALEGYKLGHLDPDQVRFAITGATANYGQPAPALAGAGGAAAPTSGQPGPAPPGAPTAPGTAPAPSPPPPGAPSAPRESTSGTDSVNAPGMERQQALSNDHLRAIRESLERAGRTNAVERAPRSTSPLDRMLSDR